MHHAAIHILVADDLAWRRQAIIEVLGTDPGLSVAQAVADPTRALAEVLTTQPDLIVLGLGTEAEDPLRLLNQVMHLRPCPVVVVHSDAPDLVASALISGATDAVSAPSADRLRRGDLLGAVRRAAGTRPVAGSLGAARPARRLGSVCPRGRRIIAVGVSTGGPGALVALFRRLPRDLPATVVVSQHILPGFTAGLVHHLQRHTAFPIALAAQGQIPRPGHALVAPDGHHLCLADDGHVRLSDVDEQPSLYVPSIDLMMQSVARSFGVQAVGVLLTGMGTDGVLGMQAIKRAGGTTVAQDEESSVVFGMNRAAIERGVVDSVVPVETLAEHLVALCVGTAATAESL